MTDATVYSAWVSANTNLWNDFGKRTSPDGYTCSYVNSGKINSVAWASSSYVRPKLEVIKTKSAFTAVQYRKCLFLIKY